MSAALIEINDVIGEGGVLMINDGRNPLTHQTPRLLKYARRLIAAQHWTKVQRLWFKPRRQARARDDSSAPAVDSGARPAERVHESNCRP